MVWVVGCIKQAMKLRDAISLFDFLQEKFSSKPGAASSMLKHRRLFTETLASQSSAGRGSLASWDLSDLSVRFSIG